MKNQNFTKEQPLRRFVCRNGAVLEDLNQAQSCISFQPDITLIFSRQKWSATKAEAFWNVGEHDAKWLKAFQYPGLIITDTTVIPGPEIGAREGHNDALKTFHVAIFSSRWLMRHGYFEDTGFQKRAFLRD
ncbi:hypothetical protein FHS76_000628 [Ochrobactrum daejeonense]|uniref:Uncharacterized protein n=1 Tax=Brucella daejeonensis TaxID=659015 RepID=A0A7W9EL84_9HYPH|nr:hypothetical protein [Brucella daejeonensis]MBB5700785.1 hypothetical protein [Brucella daejeonensis]